MPISQEYIAELSRRVDITELVRSYVELKRAGRMEKGLCPFHNEKTPSFYVYPDTASFYCFGCGAGGDAITFVKRVQNLDYGEAVKFLAARCGMPMPDEDDAAARQRQRVLSINREAARFYAGQLNTDAGKEARAYLRARRLTDKTIRSFGLGYAAASGGALRDCLKGLGFAEAELVVAGVCKKNERGSLYDAFRNRVMFPIMDLRGNVVAFGGRLMGEAKAAKYLNSGDTPVFKKSRHLYALNIARKASAHRMLLAEGYMDVISLHQAGFDTAVATLGTALAAEQAKLVANYAQECVICYDGDEAGRRATQRAIEIFRQTPVKVRVLRLSGAKDPDEFLKTYGPVRFSALLNESGNTVEYALEMAKTGCDTATPDGRAAYIKKALEVLAQQASPVEQEIYAGRLAEATDVSKQAILTQLEGVRANRRRRLAREREGRIRNEGRAASLHVPHTAKGKALAAVNAEQQLVAALLKDPKMTVPLVCGQVDPERMISPEMAQAYRLIVQKAAQGNQPELAAFSGELPEETMALLGRVLAQNHDIHFTPKDVALFVSRITEAAGVDRQAMSPQEYTEYLERQRERKQ